MSICSPTGPPHQKAPRCRLPKRHDITFRDEPGASLSACHPRNNARSPVLCASLSLGDGTGTGEGLRFGPFRISSWPESGEPGLSVAFELMWHSVRLVLTFQTGQQSPPFMLAERAVPILEDSRDSLCAFFGMFVVFRCRLGLTKAGACCAMVSEGVYVLHIGSRRVSG